MAHYHMDDAVFEIGPGWRDESLHALWRSIEGTTDRIAITVNRETTAPGAQLGALVDVAIEKMRSQLRHFELDDRDDNLEVGGAPAVGLRVQWRNQDGPIYHRHVYALVTRLLIFTGTSKWKHRALCDAELDNVIASIAFREQRP